MEEQPRVECKSILDAHTLDPTAKSRVITHTLKTSNTVALCVSDERVVEGLPVGNESTISSFTTASNAPDQVSLLLAHTQYDYWKKILAGTPAMLDLPTDRPRASHQSNDVSNIPILLDAPLTRSLTKIALEHNMGLSMVVMTGWGAILARLTSQDDIVIGFHECGLDGLDKHKQTDNDILPLRLDLSGEPSTSQLLQRVQKMASSSMDHQGLSLDNIARITGSPLFQVAFRWSQELLHSAVPILVDLELQLQEQGNEVVGNMLFPTDLFNPDTIRRHVGYLLSMLRAMVVDVDRPVVSVDLLSQAERELVLGKWNETQQDYPKHLCIHHLFEQQVERTPQATALVFNGHSLSYSELNGRANRLAHNLIGLGVQPESPVAICVGRSFAMIIGVLAILKAGGAYVPLDPSYANERLRHILMDASPGVLLADHQGQQALGERILSSVTVVDPNEIDAGSDSSSCHVGNPFANPQVPGLISSNLAYIIYTSGSTGKPKGVMVEHHGLSNLVMTRHDVYGICTSSRVLQILSLAFDACAMSIFMTLCSGASLHLIPDTSRYDLRQLWEHIDQGSITHAPLTPAIFQDAKDLPLLDTSVTLIFGGESIPVALIRVLQPLIPNGKIVNDYGPTEATVSAIAWKCPPEFDDTIVPIGRPIANKTIYLLDKHLQPVPIGATGELYIGGVGVARGYLNQPELTSTMFLPDPFAGAKDARMYKTGDLGRYLPDGNIVFLGRNDYQVKIRGFRIELGEIEARLCDISLVDKAVVTIIGEGSDRRLVGYVVAKPDDDLLSTLRSHLKSCLPDYMVPAAIVRLDSLPLNSNGKLDRMALPVPDSDAFTRQKYEAPQGDTEITVAKIWAELLHLDRVSRNDDFFALGGYSLLAVRMLNRLRQLGLATSISTFYQSPILSGLAQALEKYRSESVPPNLIVSQTVRLTPEMLPLINLSQADIDHIVEKTPGGVANIQDIYSLSPFQDGILFHHLLATKGDMYLLSARMAFDTRDLLDRYLQAFQEVVDRHDILRTAFVWENISTPAQVVWRQALLPIQELTLDPADGPIAKQLEERFHPIHFRIDLTHAPLLRFMIAQDTEGRWILFQLVHHLIGDHAAGEIRHYEIEQILHGQKHSLPTPHPFRNAIAQVRSKSHHDIHKPFFKNMIGDVSEPTFPYGMAEVQDNGAHVAESHSILPQELNNRLRFQAKQMGLSLSSLCHVAWSLVLARTTGQECVVFGTVLLGGTQNDQETDHTMGIFINTLPFRCDINSQSVRECVRQAHTRLAALLEHEHVSLALAQKCSDVPPATPLFSALLNYLHTSLPSGSSERLDTEHYNEEEQVHFPGIEFLGGRERTNYPFGINVLDYNTALGLAVQTQQPVNPSRVESYMTQALESVVAALENDPDVAVLGLEVLPIEERKLLLHGFNKTQQDYPSRMCIHHLFEQQMELNPQATALVLNGQSMTYAELNLRANKLAHHLIGLGVQPECLVAICVERSFTMIVALLAVLKAGGAYVPLDPSYASERLLDILTDASPGILIADYHGKQALGDAFSSVTVVDPNAVDTASGLNRAMYQLIPDGKIVNGYGPTETTVSAMAWECPRDFDGDNVPIGRPIANKALYLLDKNRQPVPLGAVGELYIGGVGVARGYLNRPELTAKVFLPDPFTGGKDARMYKTGDFARYLPDGNLMYLGRNDHQVKIRGFRIELGEIEARLTEHPLVHSAAVIVTGEGSGKQLASYVVAKHDDQLLRTLRSYLTSCLPEYMVPAAIVRLDSLPINSNGKLDRKALPVPDNNAYARQAYEEPQGKVESAIAHVWAEVLGHDHVSRDDNFFALGGHSLLAVRLMNRMATLGVQMPLSSVFASPTLSSFAEAASRCMDKERSTYSTIHPIPREGDLPLSFSQQRMWFLSQMEGVSDTYHIPLAVRLHGDLNRDAWQRALDTLFARHEALRSVFVAIDGQPQVRLLPAQSGMPTRWMDLRSSPDAELELKRNTAKEAKDPFDMAQGPLIRVLMVQLDSCEHVFILTQHHIVSDGWSSAIFNRELSSLYRSYRSGKSDPLPPLSIHYPDYAAWQKQWLSGDRLETHSSYWKTTLSEAPVLLNLPTDRPRPLQQSYTGDNVPICLDSHLTRMLKQLCQQHGVTLYMALLAAWGCVLSRMSGQDDIVIGSPSANRNHRQIESLIGFFLNTLALRIDLSGEPTIRQVLERVRKVSLDAQNHQDLPFEQVVDIVQPPRSLSHSPLFQVMFVLQNNEVSEWHLPGLEVVDANGSHDIAKFDLTLELYESENEIIGRVSYSTVLFDRATVERHVGYLCSMVQAMGEDVNRPFMSVDLLSQTERDLVLGTWNETQQCYPAELCIHQLFEQQVECTPQSTALVFNNQSLTYTELNVRANRLAHHLIGLGVQPETRVAICVERSTAMIVGVLAILKAGGAYVPLDPAFASERLLDILMDAGPGILVADDRGKQALGNDILASLTVVDPDVTGARSRSKSDAPGGSHSNPQVPGLTSRNLVYIIYTSGSTGKPKGVMVEHQGLFFSIAFDAHAFDVFMVLCTGGSLHILADDIRMDLPRLWDYLERESITQTVLTPAVLQHCNGLPQLSKPLTLITTAEATTSTLIKEIYQLIPAGKIVNGYGPTETTVSAITWESPRDFEGTNVPIGRPIANKTIYLLDKYRQPVPLGAVGELYIGGVGVARGYLNRSDLTSIMFLPDPFVGDKVSRMYKTGDLARYLPDGTLVYLGRNDHQVKIRGFRIELGEIEARIVDHPLVDKAAVITFGEGPDKKLVGYVVARPDDNLLNTLRSHLTSCLPEYMVPAAIIRLDSLPINSNGKLDRKALPTPGSHDYAYQVYEEPQGDTETTVAEIWADLLHLNRVSRNDNFFALGGHSLLAVQMIERLRRVGLTLSVSALFKTPTLSALVHSLDVHHDCNAPTNLITPDTTTITPEMLPLISLSQSDIDHIVERVPGGVANIQDIYSLSPLQEGIFFHHLLSTEGDPYLLISFMAFQSRVLLDKYLEANQMVVNRHDIMRTAVLHENLSTPVQVVWRQASLSVTELQLDPSNGPVIDQMKQILDPRRHRIDLTQAPLLRFTIAQDADGRWILAQLLHHLIGDHTTVEGTSIETKAFMDGQGHTLPAPQPFRNLIAQARSSHSQDDHERFFKEMLMDIDTPSFPFGLKDVHSHGDNVSSSYQQLPQDLNDRLRKKAKQLGVSVASLCHVAWALVVSRTSGEDRVVFGTVLFGRMNSGQGSDSAMGLFINTLPLRVDVTGPVRESVLQTHERLATLLEHEHASLVLAQRCSNVPQGTPLFSSLLNYRHNVSSFDETSISTEVKYLEHQERTNYPFTLSVEDHGVSLGLTANVIQPFSPIRVCGYMQQSLESLVTALEHAPAVNNRELNIVPEGEQELLLCTWNKTRQDYPDHLCIHHLFEQQVDLTPEATALVFNGQSLTYAELNERANRLARHLIGLGMRPDGLVVICVERSFAMIVGVLAILKAGGAYVPLDPVYASERLCEILMDARPRILVADDHGQQALGVGTLSSLTVVDPNVMEGEFDSNSAALDGSLTNPQVPGLTSSHLAYVIYTSGSTGKPKGVMVEHQSLVNLIMTRHNVFGVRASSRMLQFFSFAFDGCVVSVFTSLCYGGSLHLLPEAIRMDPPQLWDYLEREAITQVILPPSVLQDCRNLPQLSISLTLIVAGEASTTSLLKVIQQLIPNGRIVNDYGPTEATVSAIAWKCPPDFGGDIVPIGRPIANSTVYILDENRQPLPIGAVGELYIGGAGVARGYLNRPELTSQVFLPNPFAADVNARMYKTGDLARYHPDGNIVFLGRNDHQVKIRGFRVELGEIEARFNDHPLVDKAAVIAVGEGPDKKLVGYVVAKPDDELVNSLRSHLTSCLPDYMVPAAIVRLDSLPLNSNGKLDRKALPVPDDDSFARQIYKTPQGDTEISVAKIWEELLQLERVSRNDNFFALGGHSLLAVKMIERLRRIGLTLAVSALFKTPTLSALVQSLDVHHVCEAPTNLITPQTTTITPEILPLINLSQTDIDHIVKCVPGGIANIQDIYALSPLQEGILFHHLLATEGDPYLLISLMAFETRELLDKYLEAIQMVVNRHDILRTAVLHENLSTPAQVVWRHASLSVTEFDLNPSDGPITDQLKQRVNPQKHRIDLTRAPLLSFNIAQDADGRWLLADLIHHLVGDHTTLEVISIETKAFMDDLGHTLPAPQPFRNLIAQAQSSRSKDDHEGFFREMLMDIDTPSLPFGLKDVHGQGDNFISSYQQLPEDLNDRLRRQAKQLGVSVASLCHLAWAQVISHTSGEDRVVFGTVLFGRMNSGRGSDSAMGLFINTLPLRVDLAGTVRESVLQTHERLASLLDHEHASLALAQRCSNVPQGTPLFSAILNYRHNTASSDPTSVAAGIEFIEGEERTNYPFGLSVEDSGVSLGLTAEVVQPFSPVRVCGYMRQAIESLVCALEHGPDMMSTRELNILPEDEQELLLRTWNNTQQDYPTDLCIHHLFEQKVDLTPEATALVFNGQSLTYAELNDRANGLAHNLIGLGVQPDGLVAICVERSFAMIVAVLAIFKAGGAYVPLDPAYPSDRLRDILADAAPSIVIADESGRRALGEGILSSLTVVVPDPVIALDKSKSRHTPNPQVQDITPNNLAYVIFTSGSTGKPKGVMIEHRGVVNFAQAHTEFCGIQQDSRVLSWSSLSFDASVWDIVLPLSSGASLHLMADPIRQDRDKVWEYMAKHSITHASPAPLFLQDGKNFPAHVPQLMLVLGGEALDPIQIQNMVAQGYTVLNDYGPTETTVSAITWNCPQDFMGDIVPIGRPIANKTVYILDSCQQPVPMGAIGELYIGGTGVARGYLNRPELTSEVFLRDPFSQAKDARMYKTGDLVRYLPNGNVIFLGRNDHQVKIRGFRIELGEIEARLGEHPLVRSAAVVAMGDGSNKRLVGYVVAKRNDQLVHTLRSHLTSCLPDYMVPAAFVRLDELPMTANGKLDRHRLPLPDSDAMAHQPYEPPCGTIETALMTIWMELLNLDRIGRHDNFFMLGGHSLLAMRMISKIQTLMGFKITLGTLFMAPTIADLVPHLLTAGDTQDDAFHVVLPIKPRGNRSPLFCIHHGLGLSWSYIGLSKHLHPDQPIYGLQARGFIDGGPSATTLEDMALDYIEEIRQIQPHGPYCLLGYSFGGRVAHAMTACLERQGEQVALLAVMDTIPTDPTAETQASNWSLDDDTMLFVNRVVDSLPDNSRPYLERFRQVCSHITQLDRNHTTYPTCHTGMILFRAMVQMDPTEPLVSSDAWKPYVMGDIEMFDIDCAHFDLEQPGPLAEIGGVLAHRLNAIHIGKVEKV
ncbi:MAG: hypothetical protein J3Q66DRAFT_392743 [Benniella sp.]|nr:MAG: hypothetical protein J3Q66DRAFT_392743 [Benniella sp.]